MCLETSFELMTWQHMKFILFEVNVPVVLISSILGFKGYRQFTLVSTMTFFKMSFNVGCCFFFFPTHSVLLVRRSCQTSQHQKFSKSQVHVTGSLVMFPPELWRKTTHAE